MARNGRTRAHDGKRLGAPAVSGGKRAGRAKKAETLTLEVSPGVSLVARTGVGLKVAKAVRDALRKICEQHERRAKYIATIERAIDRAIASPHSGPKHGVVNGVASLIMTSGSNAEGFHAWPNSATRAVLLAYAHHAPIEKVEDYAAEAVEQLEWIEWWDREGHAE